MSIKYSDPESSEQSPVLNANGGVALVAGVALAALMLVGCHRPGRGLGLGVETASGSGISVRDPSLQACINRVPIELDIPQTMEAMVLGVLKGGYDHFPALTKVASRPIDDALDGHRAICELYPSMGLVIEGYTERAGYFVYSVRAASGVSYLKMIYVKVGGRELRHQFSSSLEN